MQKSCFCPEPMGVGRLGKNSYRDRSRSSWIIFQTHLKLASSSFTAFLLTTKRPIARGEEMYSDMVMGSRCAAYLLAIKYS